MYSQYYKRYVTVLLLVVYVFNRTDAAIFGFLMEPIKAELKLSDSQLGFLAGPALVLLYAVLGVPVARLADRSSRVRIMSFAIALWSGIVMLSSTVVTFWQFALVRIGVGIGEAGFSAVAQSLITAYHRADERTRALSIFMLGIPFGKVVSSLLAGWINQLYGWRMVFIVAGLPGIVLALLLKSTVREPPRPDSEGSSAATPPGQLPLRAVFAALWDRGTLRHLAVATTLANVVCFSILAWAPAFFVRNHAMATGELGTWLAVVSAVGGSTGIWLGGYLNSRRGSQDWRLRLRLIAAATALIAPVAITALWISPKELAFIVLLFAYILMFFFFGPTFSLVQELSSASSRATMASIFILIQTLAGGVVGIQLLGVMSDALAAGTMNSGTALRWSMTLTCLLAIWAAVHFLKASRWIAEESAASVGVAARSGDSPAGSSHKVAARANQ